MKISDGALEHFLCRRAGRRTDRQFERLPAIAQVKGGLNIPVFGGHAVIRQPPARLFGQLRKNIAHPPRRFAGRCETGSNEIMHHVRP